MGVWLWWVRLLSLFVLGVGSVLPTLWGNFVFDDGEALIKNKVVTKPGEVPWTKVFTKDFWGTDLIHPQSHKSYRPFTTLSYRWDVLLWGLDPFVFHLEHVVLHGINCVLVYFFLMKCLGLSFCSNGEKKMKSVAFWASMMFAVHPIHVEPLGGVVGRADLLGSLIFLLGFILCPKDGGWKCYVWVGTVSVIGSLFKETAITLCIFYILNDLIVRHHCRLETRRLGKYSISILICGTFVIWRLWFQGGPPVFQDYDNPPAFSTNLFTKVSSIIYIWMFNVFMLLCPIWSCYDWSGGCIKVIESMNDFRFYVMLVSLACGCFLCISEIRTTRKDRTPLISLIIYGSTFLPSSNLLIRVGFVIAERNLYLPSVGFCLFSSYAILRSNNLKIFSILLPLLFARSVQRSYEWIDQSTLFLSGEKVCPNNAKVHYNLGIMFADKGDAISAENYYKRAIELRPDYYQAMNNLGNLLRESKADEAEQFLRKAVNIKVDLAAAWMNLGLVLAKKRHTEAISCYNKALKFRPLYPDCYYNLGNLYREMGNSDAALESWEKALSMNPAHVQSWLNSIILLEDLSRLEDAKLLGVNALKALPASDTLHFLVGNILGKLNEYENAETHFLTAITLCDNQKKSVPVKYYSNLGVLYHRWGNKELAVEFYREALRKDPTLVSVKNNLKMLDKL